MQITITIADKKIKEAIADHLDCSVYEYFDSALLKAAKIPKVSVAVKAIFEDAKFQAELTKVLQREAASAMDDVIFDTMYDIYFPSVDTMIEACEEADKARDAEQQEQREVAEMARMVKTLERAGFKIVKA